MARSVVGRVVTPYDQSGFANANPFTDGGAWVHNSSLWTKLQASSGLLLNTQDNSGAFDDSHVHAPAGTYPSDVQVEITLSKSGASGFHENWVGLRWGSSTNRSWGIECNIHHAGDYAEIVMWEKKDGVGNYHYLHRQLSVTAPVTGDVFAGMIKGSLITAKLNGTTLHSYDMAGDYPDIYRNGQPAVGSFRDAAGAPNTYAISRVKVTPI